MKKTLWTILLVCVLVFSLAACNGGKESNGNNTSAPSDNPSVENTKNEIDGVTTETPTNSPIDAPSDEHAGDVSGGESAEAPDDKPVDLPNGSYSQGLVYTSNGDGTCYVSSIGTCTDKYVVIPAISPEGETVTGIGEKAFSSVSALVGVSIPDTVNRIDNKAFFDCDRLAAIVIPNSVSIIGNSAFYYCDSLSSVVFEDNSQLTSIGEWAFRECYNLTEMEIPGSVISIGEGAWMGCKALVSITVCDNSTSYASIDDNLYSKDGTVLVQYLKGKNETKFIIPDGVKTIGAKAFDGCWMLNSIVIPESVEYIEEEAFSGCYRLVEIINKSSLNITAGSYDHGEAALYAIEVHNDESKIVNKGDYLFYTYNGENYLFAYIGDDREITLPDDYNGESYSIYDHAFYDLDNIIKITCGDNAQITKLGESAFSNCSHLVSVVIPKSVMDIGEDAFYRCYNLAEVINKSAYDVSADADYISLEAKEIHSGVSKIVQKGDYLFYTYEGVNYLLGYVGNDNDLILPESYNGESYVIYRYAFYDKGNLTSVIIPDTVTGLGAMVFSDCTGLTSIVIPDSVVSIGNSAFDDCRNIVIYCEADSQPGGWGSNWNAYGCPVEWGYDGAK